MVYKKLHIFRRNIRFGAPGRIRTCDQGFRKPLLYPLSYGRHIEQGEKATRDECFLKEKLHRVHIVKASCWFFRKSSERVSQH